MRAAADVLGIDLLTGLRIKLAVFDSMLGFFVDLMKIGSSSSWVACDRRMRGLHNRLRPMRAASQ
jgi:hypothetical protein